MESVIRKYNSSAETPHHELELKVTVGNFREAVQRVTEDDDFVNPVVEMTANVINDRDEILRYTYSWADHELKSVQSYHSKKRIAAAGEWVLSAESNSALKPSTSDKSLIRYKFRVSLGHRKHPDFRFDFTVGYQNIVNSTPKGKKEAIFRFADKSLDPLQRLLAIPESALNIGEIEVECVTKPVDIDACRKVEQMIRKICDPNAATQVLYQEHIYEVAKWIAEDPERFRHGKNRLKGLLNNVLAVPKNMYAEIFPPIGYYCTAKADGIRTILVLGPESFWIDSAGFHMLPEKFDSVTIVDCERLDEDVFLAFDVIAFENRRLADEPFSTRHAHIDAAVQVATRAVNIVAKQYIVINVIEDIHTVLRLNVDFETDGIILTSPNKGYTATKSYKWKPADKITIDFYAVECPKNMLGILPYMPVKGKTLYLLHVGISHHVREKLSLAFIHLDIERRGAYYPIQFSPSSNPLAYLWYVDDSLKVDGGLDRKIVELGVDTTKLWLDVDNPYKIVDWHFHKVRTDREGEISYYGNDYKVAELTWMMYEDPFTETDLIKPSLGYFTRTADTIYKASNAYKRFVVRTLIKANLFRAKWIIDLAGGRGADLSSYEECKIENVLFEDIDATAIAELICRKFSIKTGGNETRGIFGKKPIGTTVHTLVTDLTKPTAELVAETYQYGVNVEAINGFVCNFALHYMCKSRATLKSFLGFVSRMACKGAVFIFTVMDGGAVFDALEKSAGDYKLIENGIVKYHIQKRYKSKTLSDFGQTIAVKLPFANDLYEEPLCNVKVVLSTAKSLDLAVEVDESMDSRVDQFSAAMPYFGGQLSDVDLQYLKLHRVVTVRKI